MRDAQRTGGGTRRGGRRTAAPSAAHARDHGAGVDGDEAQAWMATKRESDEAIPEREVVQTVIDFAPLWDELFPAEQARIVRLLVERVDLAPDGMQVRMRAEGLHTLVAELRSREVKAA
jgi:hypothetical protein